LAQAIFATLAFSDLYPLTLFGAMQTYMEYDDRTSSLEVPSVEGPKLGSPSMHRVFGCCFSLGFLAHLFFCRHTTERCLDTWSTQQKKEVGWNKAAQDQVYGLPAQVSGARI